MAKARPLRKAGRKTDGKPVKNRPGPSAQLKRPAAKQPLKPSSRSAARKSVSPRPVRRKAALSEEPKVLNPEIPPPLPAPIASFTF